MNFAPVVDINTNSKNPIIGVRSYGKDKENGAKKALGKLPTSINQEFPVNYGIQTNNLLK